MYQERFLLSENTDPSDDSAKLWTSTSLEMAKGKTGNLVLTTGLKT